MRRGGSTSTARPPEGAQHRSAQRGGFTSTARPPEGAQHRSAQRGGFTSTARPRLALFDLDHTLLLGDSDVLWCEFLMDRGLIDRAAFGARNAEMEAAYKAGTVGVDEFAAFYLSTLAGRTPAEWEPLRQAFLDERVLPCIPPGARALVQREQAQSARVAMTTATNRYITELTARAFGIDHLLATEPQCVDGRFTGAVAGIPNMRQGKVERLHAWLREAGAPLADWHSVAYSDSINDLPLLEAVDEPVAVQPDAKLAAVAAARGWRTLAW